MNPYSEHSDQIAGDRPPVDEHGDPVLLTETDFVDPETVYTEEDLREYAEESAREDHDQRETEAHITRLWNER